MALKSEEPLWSCFTCTLYFDDQLAFFLHLHHKHPNFNRKFDVDLDEKTEQIFCQMCDECFASEREHETRHYSTKIGVGSLIECGRCYKTFKTLDLMKDHNRTVHEVNELKIADQQCFVCFQWFKNRNLRDQHLVTHISGLISKAMDRIDELQSRLREKYTSNVCPLCSHIVSTRKSLKQHIAFQHLLRSQKDFNSLLVDKTNLTHLDEELRIVRKLINNPGLLWKRQIKAQQKPTTKKVKNQKAAKAQSVCCKQESIEDLPMKVIKREPEQCG